MNYNYINTREDLIQFADKFGLRPDWHEPDEQGVTARVVGTVLDNAFGAYGHDRQGDFSVSSTFSNAWEGHELRVVLEVDALDEDGARHRAIVNLATLLSWAADLTVLPPKVNEIAYDKTMEAA